MPRGDGEKSSADQAEMGPVAARRWYLTPGDNSAMVDAAFRQLRIAAAIVQFPFVLTYEPTVESVQLPMSNLVAAIGLLVCLAGVNLITLGREKLRTRKQRLALSLFTLSADAAVTSALALMFASAGTDLAWFLMLIPVLEAGMRFGLLGALLTWLLLLLGGSLIERFQSIDAPWVSSISDLTQRLGVVLLVSIPAIHLGQRLMRDIRSERVITAEAQSRSRLLERVVETSRTISKLESDTGIVDAVVQGGIYIGLDIVDVCIRGDGRGSRWMVVASRSQVDGLSLPDPNGDLSVDGTTYALRAGDDRAVDSELRRNGISSLVIARLAGEGEARVMLRGALRSGRPLNKTMADCTRLLAGNVSTAFENQSLIGELKAVQGELHHQAYHDQLTNLPNRSQFVGELSQRLQLTRSTGEIAAVAFVDLDRFKPVNDSLGHEVGNELLQAVARRLEGAVRRSDLVARFGGDEFVILFADVDPEDRNGELATLADRVCAAISTPFSVGGHEVVISCSVGIALTAADADPDEIVRRADIAMYEAKGSGRARWVPYRADLDAEVLRRIQLEGDLRRALTEGAIDLNYQAIFATKTGLPIAAESLVRWNHPTFGPQAPDLMVSIAEEAGFIDQLGSYILHAACTQAARWQADQRRRAPAIAVNVSPRQLLHPSFFEVFDHILAETGADARGLILEVTENVVAEGEDADHALREVRQRGVRLALDDFGQGQSSLTHLRRVPVDVLKVDKAFMRNTDDPMDRAVLRSIVQMSHDLGLLVVAEGVETKSHLALLRDIGCDLAQGYLLHRPSTAEDLDRRLDDLQRARRPNSSAPSTAPTP